MLVCFKHHHNSVSLCFRCNSTSFSSVTLNRECFRHDSCVFQISQLCATVCFRHHNRVTVTVFQTSQQYVTVCFACYYSVSLCLLAVTAVYHCVFLTSQQYVTVCFGCHYSVSLCLSQFQLSQQCITVHQTTQQYVTVCFRHCNSVHPGRVPETRQLAAGRQSSKITRASKGERGVQGQTSGDTFGNVYLSDWVYCVLCGPEQRQQESRPCPSCGFNRTI